VETGSKPILFFWLTAEEWTALGTVSIAILTLFLVVAGIIQLRRVRSESRKTLTLQACTNYEFNAVIYHCIRRLRDAADSGDLENNPRKHRTQIATLLNYLDGIAIGVNQGIYSEEIVWDNLHAVIQNHMKQYVYSGLLAKAGYSVDDYKQLVDLANRWSAIRPRFHDGFRFWRRR
jgi:hypothetical protein